MISTIVSRLVILVFGTLYPAYASYKAVRTKNVKEYVKWMMYWIVFALFTCIETFTDVFFSFWFPFYYEIKIVLVVWLLSPATKGSSILYRKFVHPMLSKREQEIDEYISRAKEQGYHTVLHLGSKGVTYATNVIMQTAIKGGGGIVNHLRRSYSLSDLSSNSDLMADVNRNSKSLLDDGMDIGDSPREIRQRITRKAAGSHVDLYFPEMDVDLRSHSHNSRDLPVSLSQIRSSEDISSGYSSADLLYSGDLAQGTVGESGAPLVRTSSVGATRARARGGRVSVRKAPTTAEDTDNEDDFLTEGCRSRTTYNPYTTHPIFTLYPELFSIFPMNSSDFLSPEALELILLKNISSKIVQIKEEPVHNLESDSVFTPQERKMSNTEQGQVGIGSLIETSNVDNSAKNINLVETNDKIPPEKFNCGKELLDDKKFCSISNEVKSENERNVLDSTESSCSDIQRKINKVTDNSVCKAISRGAMDNEISSSSIDTEVFIKESEFPSDSLNNNNMEDKINNSVISKTFNISDDMPSVKEISAEDSDDEFLDVESEVLEATCTDKSVNNDNTNILPSKLEQNHPQSKIFVEPLKITEILNSSNEQISEVPNEHSITVENIKDFDIRSVESDLGAKDIKSNNLEVSDIESVGSLTDDCNQIDILTLSPVSISNKSDLQRKGKYGKMKAPLPPAETVKDGNTILPIAQQNISVNFLSSNVDEVSSKIEACTKDISGTPDLISQLGEKSESVNEKNNVETKREPVENISTLVSKEIKKTDDREALSKFKNKEKSESLGMSRFLPKNNMPLLFGIFSLKDESSKAEPSKPTATQIEKTVEENTAVENVIELPEKSVFKKVQNSKLKEQNIEKKQTFHERDTDERMKRNAVRVKIRELSKSPSSHRKH